MNITVFGEILWDVFPDEQKIGGAPFNFASHVCALGGKAAVISAVGKDDLGFRALACAREMGVDVSAVAELDHPTGFCRVTLNNGTPSYELVRDVAYDFIPVPADFSFGDAFYFGTLAQRSAFSAESLEKLLEHPFREVFFDINIRQSFYSDEMIDRSLKKTTIFKISREEIGVLKIDGTPEEIARETAKKYPNLKLVIVTLDKDGSFVLDTGTGEITYSPQPSSAVVSTVGAGDSFSACFMFNYLSGASVPLCLSRATALSDYVVTQLGAIPADPEELIPKIK